MTDLIMAADTNIWNTIHGADVVALDGDKNNTMIAYYVGDDTITLEFTDEIQYEFANDCLAVTHRNRVTLTDIEGEKIVIECFDLTPADFPL